MSWGSEGLDGGQGMPLEIQIALANALQRDPWFCVPVQAEDTYVTNMFALIQSTLDSNLTPRVEMGNECWNGGFGAQQAYEYAHAADYGGTVWYDHYAGRCVEVFALARAECPRVIRVVGTQTQASAATTIAIMNNPHASPPVYTVADEVAIAPYFVNEAVALSTVTHESWAADPQLFFDQIYAVDLPNCISDLAGNYNWLAANYPSIPLVGYEGGNQLVKTDSERFNSTIDNGYKVIMRDSRMYDLYLDWLTGISPYLVFVCHYHHCGVWGAPGLGYFGAQRYYLDTEGDTPKLDALMDWAAANEDASDFDYADPSLSCAVRYASFYANNRAP